MFTAAIFLVDRVNGGVEEGFITCGEPMLDLPTYTTETEDEAQTACDRLQQYIDEQQLNAGRRILHGGIYRPEYSEGPVPLPFPATRPHYE
jgi:hypothetical protein